MQNARAFVEHDRGVLGKAAFLPDPAAKAGDETERGFCIGEGEIFPIEKVGFHRDELLKI